MNHTQSGASAPTAWPSRAVMVMNRLCIDRDSSERHEGQLRAAAKVPERHERAADAPAEPSRPPRQRAAEHEAAGS
jgi:hypothetical protein